MGKCAKRDKIDNDVAIIVGFYMIFKAYFAPQLIKKNFLKFTKMSVFVIICIIILTL